MSSTQNQINFAIFRRTMQQQCITRCVNLADVKFNPQEQICVKNCYAKLGAFAKLSKELGVPIK